MSSSIYHVMMSPGLLLAIEWEGLVESCTPDQFNAIIQEREVTITSDIISTSRIGLLRL